MKQHAGIALLTILIFMQIWTLLSLLALETAWLATKASASGWQHRQRLITEPMLLKKFEHQSAIIQLKCAIDQISTYELLSKPNQWWQSKFGCHEVIGAADYYYVIERLGVDPCGYLKLKPQRLLPAYFRLSLKVIEGTQQTVWQSTWVKPVQDTGGFSCLGKNHLVQEGQQMRRHLT